MAADYKERPLLSQKNMIYLLMKKEKQIFHQGCSEGWVFYLACLKSFFESGIDLRNKNEKLKKMINS